MKENEGPTIRIPRKFKGHAFSFEFDGENGHFIFPLETQEATGAKDRELLNIFKPQKFVYFTDEETNKEFL